MKSISAVVLGAVGIATLLAACSSDPDEADTDPKEDDDSDGSTQPDPGPDPNATDGGPDGSDTLPACSSVELSATAESFALPAGYGDLPFIRPADTSSCAGGDTYPTFSTFDIDGDKILDLVVTRSCADEQVGSSKWLVHKGGAAGFAATPTAFALPAGYDAFSFIRTADTSSCDNGDNYPAFTMLDIDGDKIPDLVVTRSCADEQVGTSKWLVHKGTASGFAATASSFTLPAGYDAFAFVRTADTPSCDNGDNYPGFTLLDVDGDKLPDLVVTRSCADPQVGTSQWLVYKGGASGFAGVSPFTLPTGYDPFAFVRTADTASCANGDNYPGFAVLDVDGDKALDLVVTRSCTDMQVGSSQWLVHKGAASGFAAAPTPFTLPSGYSELSFINTADEPSCANGDNYPAFTTLDVDRDGKPDLLVTRACNDVQVGTSKWLIHKGGAAGFAAAPTALTLPAGYAELAFDRTTNSPSCLNGDAYPAFSTLDLDGDQLFDFTLTRVCTAQDVGTAKWLVHRARCIP